MATEPTYESATYDVNQIADMVQRQLAGGDVSNSFGFQLQELINTVIDAKCALVEQEILQKNQLNVYSNVSSAWLQSYENVPVFYDTITKQSYSDLPQQIMMLPDEKGVYFISPQGDFAHPFMKSMFGMDFIFSSDISFGETTFRNDRNRVYYYNINPNIKNVYMVLVPQNDNYVPREKAYQIRDMAVKLYLQTKPINPDYSITQRDLTQGEQGAPQSQPTQQR
jgi:hypothetical protein